MNFWRLAFVIVALLFLSGCIQKINILPMKPEMLTTYQSSGSVKLVNAQNKGVVRALGLHKADMTKATQLVVDDLSRELSKAGVQVSDNSTKTLKLSVEKFKRYPHIWLENYRVWIKVEMDNGRTKEYTPKNAGEGMRSIGFALTKGVAEIFNDAEIRSYIEGRPYVAEADKSKVPSGGPSAKVRLQKLKELLDQGLISKGDYNKKKDSILNAM